MRAAAAGVALLSAALMASAQQAPPVTTAASRGVVHTPAVDIAYESYGTARAALPVIAVNGGPGLSHVYMLQNDMWQRVAAKRQVIFYDQRGTGGSTRVDDTGPQTMDAQVADLEAVRAHFKLNRFELVGDSYGGLLAMAYAAAHPEHVDKLVLSDSAPPAWKDMVHLLPQVFPDIEEEDAQVAKNLGNSNAGAQEQLRNHFRMIFYSEEKRDAYMAGFKEMGYSPEVGEAVEKATADLDLTAALPKFNFPTLVITGRYDMNVAPLTAWRMAHAIPGARFVVFEKSGHLPSYEEPEKYQKTLEAFFEDH